MVSSSSSFFSFRVFPLLLGCALRSEPLCLCWYDDGTAALWAKRIDCHCSAKPCQVAHRENRFLYACDLVCNGTTHTCDTSFPTGVTQFYVALCAVSSLRPSPSAINKSGGWKFAWHISCGISCNKSRPTPLKWVYPNWHSDKLSISFRGPLSLHAIIIEGCCTIPHTHTHAHVCRGICTKAISQNVARMEVSQSQLK